MGRPAAVGIIPEVHGREVPTSDKVGDTQCSVTAIQLSQAGAPTAFSVGWDGDLVETDVTTCTTYQSMAALPCLLVVTNFQHPPFMDPMACCHSGCGESDLHRVVALPRGQVSVLAKS